MGGGSIRHLHASTGGAGDPDTRGRGFEATPLLWDGVLYVTGSNNFAWALDARTGRPFWQYRRDLPADLTYGAQAPVNRGFGLLDHRLFMVMLTGMDGSTSSSPPARRSSRLRCRSSCLSLR